MSDHAPDRSTTGRRRKDPAQTPPKPAKPTKRPRSKPGKTGKSKPARAGKKTPREPLSRADVSRAVSSHAQLLLEECAATAILVYVAAMGEAPWREDPGARLILVARSDEEAERYPGRPVVRVPRVRLSRTAQVKVAVFLALSQGLLSAGDRVVCLAGPAEEPSVDMLLVMQVDREFQGFLDHGEAPQGVRADVLARIVELAADLGSEGREGKPVGTLFVVGDEEAVVPLTRQRILNPFHGYPESERNILDQRLEDTIKELATVDGAFVVRGDGVVLSSGTYLKTSTLPEEGLPRGLGARHQAAAGITFATDCLAVTVSESTGTVTVFRRGRVVAEIEKPQKASGR